MGLFDSLYIAFPCGKRVEFQSKAGESCCNEYAIHDVPAVIAADLIGEKQTCDSCGRLFEIFGSVSIETKISDARPWISHCEIRRHNLGYEVYSEDAELCLNYKGHWTSIDDGAHKFANEWEARNALNSADKPPTE